MHAWHVHAFTAWLDRDLSGSHTCALLEQHHAAEAMTCACWHACMQVTLVAESFGGCLGLRVAAAAPDLVQRLVLVNPATSFARAMGGLPGIIAGSNLLSLFPAPLYQVPVLACS